MICSSLEALVREVPRGAGAVLLTEEAITAGGIEELLMVLNERVFRRGRETRPLPTLMVVGASNRLPEDDALGALFDRFLLRVRCDNVQPEELPQVLVAGWKLDLERDGRRPSVTTDDVCRLQGLLRAVDLSAIRAPSGNS